MSQSRINTESLEALSKAIENADFISCDKLLTQFETDNHTPDQIASIVDNLIKFKSQNWTTFRSLDNIVNVIKTLQSHSLNIKLSENYFPTVVFIRILFEAPQLAYDLLSNTTEPTINLSQDVMSMAGSYYGLIGPADRSDVFVDSMKLLFDKTTLQSHVKHDLEVYLLNTLVENDNPSINLDPKNHQAILELALHWDSVNIFRQLLPTINAEAILSNAINEGAFKCVKEILNSTNLEKDKLDELARQVAKNGDATMLLVLCKDHFEEASEYLFGTKSEFFNNGQLNFSNKEQLKNCLLKLFRFSSFEIVEQLFNTFLDKQKSDTTLQSFLQQIYVDTKDYFLSIAPYFARYKNPKDLKAISTSYSGKDTSLQVQSDIEFGTKRLVLVERLLDRLNNPKPYIPEDSKFKKLPPSNSGSQRAAALLEEISKHCYEIYGSKNTEFLKLRKEGSMTFVQGRYRFGSHLIHSVYYNSDSINRNANSITSQLYYSLIYKGIELNKIHVDLNSSFKLQVAWHHGQADLHDTWPDIENLFEEIWSMNLAKPTHNDQKKEYEDKLTNFYSKLAELVWLIGNTQPLNRGTGTVAELMLAILHLHHGLQPPTLKVKFPQLDVLDISIPLEDYIKLFPQFFEPCTIPEHLRHLSVSPTMSVLDQMNQFYIQLKEEKSQEILLQKSSSSEELKYPPGHTTMYPSKKEEINAPITGDVSSNKPTESEFKKQI